MAGFQDIIGHNQIVEHLKNAIQMEKVSHAYILNGESNSGKMMLAEAFAMALQCEAQKAEPCMNCRSCHQAVEHNQPDIIYVTHEKPNVISVDDIRHQLNNDIVIKPYSSKYKIYIIDECHSLTNQAWQAFLKCIEEPPTYTIFIFCTTDPQKIPETIKNRVQRFTFNRISTEQIRERLAYICRMEGFEII